MRRLKNYSAQSGYVYQYCYEGYYSSAAGGIGGAEYVFTVSVGSKRRVWVSVFLADEAIHPWEQEHARTLSSTERYAVAKMALFQAFDERATPALMKRPVRVRAADLQAILETLGISPAD